LVVTSSKAPDRDPTAWAGALLHRIGADIVEIPPLREDARDILSLAELFLTELGSSTEGTPRLMTERTKNLLSSYPWPGNTRELRRALEDAAGRAGSQPIAPRHLPPGIADQADDGETSGIPTLEQVECEHIRDVMQRTGGVRSRAARLLGIASSTLYEKLKKYGLDS
jgi:DNA-binding NtrC family response regulator